MDAGRPKSPASETEIAVAGLLVTFAIVILQPLAGVLVVVGLS